jgi:hypothetical protein
MKKIRSFWVALVTLAALMQSQQANAALSINQLKVEVYFLQQNEYIIELRRAEMVNGHFSYENYPDADGYYSIGPALFGMSGNDLTFKWDSSRPCGKPCIAHVVSTGDKVVGVSLDKSSVDAGFSGNLTLNTLPPSFDYYLGHSADSDGIWMDLTGGYPPSGEFTITAATVPEQETYIMLLAGLGLMGFVARRRKQA